MKDVTLSYWQNLHSKVRDKNGKNEYKNLQIVCCTGLSGIYNNLVHRFQKRSLMRALFFLGDISEKKILEIGCGTGRWTGILAKLSKDVTAIDVSGESIEINRSLLPEVNLRQMSVTRLDFSDHQFDIIFSVTVLQHIPYFDKKRAIAEIRRCLKRGGYAIILEQIRPKNVPAINYEKTITFPYASFEWLDSFERAGLEVIWQERVLFLPLVVNVFLPLKRLAAKMLRKKSSATTGTNNRLKKIENKLNYVITLLLVPFSFVLEYIFIVLGAGKWFRQDIFGRHQTYIFKKVR